MAVEFYPLDSPYVLIRDNGSGMNETQLVNAMRFGSHDPLASRSTRDLGRFGLGLKTASLSQCRKLTVVSKRHGKLCGACWDLDLIAEKRDWSLGMLDAQEASQLPGVGMLDGRRSGTVVLWQDLDRLKLGEVNLETGLSQKMDRVRDHLSLVFHRYITGDSGIARIGLSVNGRSVPPRDPFLASKSTQTMADEVLTIDGQEVRIRAYVLPHPSRLSPEESQLLGGSDGFRREQGFYVYRNGRLLVWGTWFHLMRKGELSKLARIRIDIPNSLDHLWSLDIKKSMAMPPTIIVKNLSSIINTLAQQSEKTWTFRGRKETGDGPVHVWDRVKGRDGAITYVVNREHPLIKDATSVAGEEVERALNQIERGLPLNQLYIDLTGDEILRNEAVQKRKDVARLLQEILSRCRTPDERERTVETLRRTEPFDQYPDLFSGLGA